MEIGIIGLGSIGQRHAKELYDLGVSNIVALRTKKGAKEPSSDLARIIEIDDPHVFLNQDLDGYIISNPTNLHVEAINLIKSKHRPIFVEKPVSDNLSTIDSISDLDKSLVQIGFCLRYDLFFQKIKNIIQESTLGTVYASQLYVGQYLPTWHPYTDYRKEYFSNREMGGGALRTLSHEIDLAIYFFGIPDQTKTITTKCSDLEIDVDDYAMVYMKYPQTSVKIEMDFISKDKKREGVIYGTEADLKYNYFARKISLYDKTGNMVSSEAIEPSNMYREQMLAFIRMIDQGKIDENSSTWEDNIEIMKIINDEQYF